MVIRGSLMTTAILSLIAGLALLYFGAEGLVGAAARLALRAGVSPLVIGLTIVAFGTSAPELVVSVQSAVKGLGGIAVGNVVGSNTFNIAFILGLSAVVRPMRVQAQLVRFDVPVMLAVAIVGTLLLLDGHLSRLEAAFMLTGLIAYTADSIRRARRESNPAVLEEFTEARPRPRSVWIDLAFIIGGLALLVYGSRLFVGGAVELARWWGLSETVIGLTIVAAGTSLPELATSLLAAFRKQDDIAIGNIVGSNIFNIIGILGVSGMVVPLTAGAIQPADLGMMIGVSIVLLPLIRSNMVLARWEGVLLLAAYSAYLAWLLRV